MIALLLSPAWGADVTGTTAGELRYIGSLPPDLQIDADGTELAQGAVLDQRLRAGGKLKAGQLTLATEWDLFTGQLAGDTWDLSSPDSRDRDTRTALTLQGFTPRTLMAGVRTDWFDLQGGLVTAQWGLGLVANAGATDPLFGRTDFGDRVVRLRMTTAPAPGNGPAGRFPLYLTLAGDRVIEDEIATVATGEVAWQGIASVLYLDPDGRALGMYGVHRWQREADAERHTIANVVDVYGALPVPIGDWKLSLSGEGAAITGRTDVTLTYVGTDGLDVRSGGAAGKVAFASPEDRATMHLRAGWASGDGAADDGSLNSFSFDRDYDVGMVLFDEFQGAMDVGTWGLLTDPANAATPPDGVDAVTNEGAFRSAVYLQPAVVVRPLEGLSLEAGLVFAWSTAPIAQPFYSFRAGGDPRNPFDQPTTGNALGTEVDWGVGYGSEIGDGDHPLRPDVLLQGGHAFLSRDLATAEQRRVDLVTATARLRW